MFYWMPLGLKKKNISLLFFSRSVAYKTNSSIRIGQIKREEKNHGFLVLGQFFPGVLSKSNSNSAQHVKKEH